MSDAVTLSAHAKVNLFLRVLAREADGYHNIETLFCRLELADTLSARPSEAPGATLDVDGADTGPPEDNLAVRAARAVQGAVRQPAGVHLSLTKRIPVGAGLGGGSADAAAALMAVNQLHRNAVPPAELMHHAARIGADVPFCLSGASLALAWGHGERLLTLARLPPAPVLLLTPPLPVSTVEAYRWLDGARTSKVDRGGLRLDAEALGGWSDIARMAGNDFESPVFGKLPVVREAFEALARTRPLLCRMTGSGSTLFAVYRTEQDREDAQMQLGKKHGGTTPTRTI